MNPEPYQQGTFIQTPQQQRQTAPQPILRLSNPTTYHLQQTQLRKNQNQKQISNDGAPPTPNNSFQANNTLSNNSFSNTIDPQVISMNRQLQQQYSMNPIKHESNPSEILEMDFDHPNPLTNSPRASPTNHNFESDFGRSFKPPSHLDTLPSFGDSPGNNHSLYSPGSLDNVDSVDNVDNVDNVDYSYIDDFPMSAPTSTAIGLMDVKANMNNNTKRFIHPHNNLGQISMSLPVGTEWCLDNNFPNTHPFPANEIISPSYMDPENVDSQKEAMLFEKRRRRRESHNAVERRRRDNINEKIHELSTLLPDLYVDSANKPNKGVILRKSVDYIRLLQSLVEQERSRNVKLESQVRELTSQTGIPIDNNSGSASSRSDLNNSSVYGSM
uniref:Microphthalmia-associated transcription factor n=1 Tax=Anthurium amnicola TaxID=1678845 RepID=A0A1D1Z6K9_9ARAE